MSAPSRDPSEAKLVTRIAVLALELGFNWEGPGDAFLLDPADSAVPTWRVYSEWSGGGVIADVRVADQAVVRIADIGVETHPDPTKPDAAAVVRFVREKVAGVLEWPWPDQDASVQSAWDEADRLWRVSAGGVEASVRGKQGTLRLVSVSR